MNRFFVLSVASLKCVNASFGGNGSYSGIVEVLRWIVAPSYCDVRRFVWKCFCEFEELVDCFFAEEGR